MDFVFDRTADGRVIKSLTVVDDANQGGRRRPLLLAAIVGFAIANTVTTISTSYILTMVARFLAGVGQDCCGRSWQAMPHEWFLNI